MLLQRNLKVYQNRFEGALVSIGILFRKVAILPQGKLPRSKVVYAIFQLMKFMITVNHFQYQ